MTDRRYIHRFLLLVLAISAVAVAGCGGGSSSYSGSTETQATSEKQSASRSNSTFEGRPEIVKFGRVAPASEREAASKVLQQNLEARERADFAGQCESLSLAAQQEVTGPANRTKAAQECQTDLKELAEPLKSTAAVRADTMDEPIALLRVKGSSAYALYHGNDGNDWAMPLTKESGKWKVAAIIATELG